MGKEKSSSSRRGTNSDRASKSKSTSKKSGESSSKSQRDWRFTQWFKKMPSQNTLPDADVLSAVEFDHTGSFLATGDRGGRIVVLEFDGEKTRRSSKNKDSSRSKSKKSNIHYKFHCEFQSHDPEFDYVKSISIDEKINKIKWLAPTNNARYMLTTNEKIVKLWKIYEKEMKLVSNLNSQAKTLSKLRVPTLETTEAFVISEPRRFYANVHEFAINSLSVNSDGASFLSADNLRINLWDLDVYDVSFNLIDLKPKDPQQQLLEVITGAEFHPLQCNTFMYSTNFGTLQLADMRDRAHCDGNAKQFGPSSFAFRNQEEKIMKEVIQTITDCKFSPNGRHMVSRDYLTVKLWDINMEREPVETIHVHDYLRTRLTDLYHNEYIFDNFGVSINAQNKIAAGGYNNYFHIYDLKGKTDTFVEASKNPTCTTPLLSGDQGQNLPKTDSSATLMSTQSQMSMSSKKKRSSKSGLGGLLSRSKKAGKQPKAKQSPEVRKKANVLPDILPENLDYEKKILQVAWHPTENAVAVAGLNNLFIYSQ